MKLICLLLLLTIQGTVGFCPSRCLCFRTTVRCMFLQLARIPKVPPETTILDLRFNHIKDIPVGTFRGLPKLNTLLLNNNQLTRIHPNTFTGLSELRYLYLYKNKIHTLEPDAFSGLEKLEQLYIHFNEIEELESDTFANLPNLERLFLHNNKLKRLPRGVFSHIGSLRRLRLDSNALICDCQMMWLAEMIKKNRGNTQAAATCEYPVSLKGKTIQSVPTDDFHCKKPRFLTEPTDIAVTFGHTAHFQCRADGDPAPEIIWLKNSNEIVTNSIESRYKIRSDGTLMIEDTTEYDQGVYECVARNLAGEVKAVGAKLRYLSDPADPIDTTAKPNSFYFGVKPTLTEKPRDQTIIEGHGVQFVCRPEGHPNPVITWTKDGDPIPDSGRHRITSAGAVLKIDQVTSEDEAIYKCLAVNIAGRADAAAQLRVRPTVPPQFTRIPSNTQIHALTHLLLECAASGDPQPTIRWKKDGLLVPQNRRVITSQSGDLTIFNITTDDGGTYECEAENSGGFVSAPARVYVLGNEIPFDGDVFVRNAIDEAINNVDNAINQTKRELHDRTRKRTPQDLLALFRYPSNNAQQLGRAAEVYERTLELIYNQVHEAKTNYNVSGSKMRFEDIISPSHLNLIANMSGCQTHRQTVDCRDMCYHQKYRTLDGTCNNLQKTMWGSSLTPLKRLLRPHYDNGFSTPVGWNRTKLHFGHPKPSARLISTQIVSASRVEPDEQYTHMLMQWGQFLDHDMTFTPMAVSNAQFSNGAHCNETCENVSPCFPINVPPHDPRIHRHRCMGVTRSSAICGSGMTSVFFRNVHHREQMNQITAFIDASNVYGSSEEDSHDLRDLSSERGLLRTGLILNNGKHLLPYNVDAPVDCQVDPNNAHIPCFLAGDHRANEQLGLLSMHTIWMREHNRVATELLRLNPHWDGNMLFHEARKIVGAQMQHITYNEWLPKILGTNGMEQLGVYKGYDPTIDPTISNVFATAAFRFGHTLINPFIYRLNATFQETREGHLPLHKAFFAPFRIVEEGGIDSIIRGMFGVGAKKFKPDNLLNTELTEKLFKLAHAVALDLAALNIQRGRDHGLASYNEWRKFCGLYEAETFDDLAPEIQDNYIRRKLADIYGHPGNIDLWLGGLVEDSLDGSMLGPTFQCILQDQFRRNRDGDRFWYENPGVLKPGQLTAIKQTSLARVLCDNGDDIKRVQRDVFKRADIRHEYKDCEELPYVDLKLWTDCCHECSKSGEFNSITSQIYRKKRSLEYSFPEDSPQNVQSDVPFSIKLTNRTFTRSKIKEHKKPAKLDNNMPSINIDMPNLDNDMPNKLSGSQVDLIDARIEGMETVMGDMQKQIKKLHKKVKKLEKKLRVEETSCLDDQGKKRADRERWKVDDCQKCICKYGKAECSIEKCHPVKCDYPIYLPGKCCPIC